MDERVIVNGWLSKIAIGDEILSLDDQGDAYLEFPDGLRIFLSVNEIDQQIIFGAFMLSAVHLSDPVFLQKLLYINMEIYKSLNACLSTDEKAGFVVYSRIKSIDVFNEKSFADALSDHIGDVRRIYKNLISTYDQLASLNKSQASQPMVSDDESAWMRI